MGRLSGFDYKKYIKKLKKLGFIFDCYARGSHEIWWNPVSRARTTIPNHPGDIAEGTLNAIVIPAYAGMTSALSRSVVTATRITGTSDTVIQTCCRGICYHHNRYPNLSS